MTTPTASASHTPATEAVVAMPPLDDIVALEVVDEGRSALRHSTRDPARVKAVLDALNAGTWTRGHMPRCMPALWVRFVPPSAERATTAVFCQPDGGAAFWIPGGDTLHLDLAASHALYRALLPVSRAPGGPIPPTAVTDNLATFSLSLVLGQPAGEDLQRLTLTTASSAPSLAKGTAEAQRSAIVVITPEQAGTLTVVLEQAGLFSRATTYHQSALDGPTSTPPADSTEGPPAAPSRAGCAQVSVVAGGWRRTWQEDASEAVFAHILSTLQRDPSVPEAAAPLAALKRQVR